MTTPLRLLSGIPLMVMAAALLALGLQRIAPRGEAPASGVSYGDLLIEDGQYNRAVAWENALAHDGDPASLRRLAAAADLAGQQGTRASALQRLVRSGRASFDEHVEAARLLAWAGALPDALTVLYNAERRFPGKADIRFLSFYAALARDCRRPDIAAPLARSLWQTTGDDDALRELIDLNASR